MKLVLLYDWGKLTRKLLFLLMFPHSIIDHSTKMHLFLHFLLIIYGDKWLHRSIMITTRMKAAIYFRRKALDITVTRLRMNLRMLGSTQTRIIYYLYIFIPAWFCMCYHRLFMDFLSYCTSVLVYIDIQLVELTQLSLCLLWNVCVIDDTPTR